ncbi:MAG TPA: lytic transglycosylase domain-containing protein [Pyrinomonadaceae bacterium]|nr:lytic transglycosylase domain-containing protein [Pyrinomonadaceae bacterium]
MRITYRQHQVVFVSVVFFFAAAAALLLPFASVSCSSAKLQHKAGEAEAVERLRALTHAAPPATIPAESAVTPIETQYVNTAAGALARFIRARIKIAAGDFAGASTLLDTNAFGQQTALGDYALLLRADALAKTGRRTEARAAYEKLARDYPQSMRARDASLRNAELALQDNAAAAVPLLLKNLSDADDAGALLLTAKAYEQTGDTARAIAAYRRLYFFAPASTETNDAASALTRLGSTLAPASPLEATTRANRLYDAKVYAAAAAAFGEAFTRFPATATTDAQLRRGIAAFNVGSTRLPEAAAALNAVPASVPDARVEALYYLAQTHAKARQWEQARGAHAEMRRAFPEHTLTKRALVAAGLIARDAKNTVEAANFFRTAVSSYAGAVEVAQAQFELAWAAHESKNYAESSRLLLEHLSVYADRNTDNRGRAGYWAARDAERAGQLPQARALYQAMLQRYDANWYGDLAKQRLDALKRTNPNASADFPADSPVARAVVNLSTISVAEETATAEMNASLAKADQLNVVGLDEYALDEVNEVLESAPRSPRLNLAKARIYRTRQQNLQAFLALQKSYPDYSQMKPEELTRDEWDVFYPLAYWDAITREARVRSIDPYRVAGLIRQESVFDPLASSHANAYGLMQLLVETAQVTARKYGITRTVTRDALLADPQLNIQIGTGYMRDQLDRFGRIEYVAAAYNAGPGRAVRWRVELPAEMDEWAEAVPFKETRGYVQGVVRNTLQYKRLYDEQGRFRAEVGARAVRTAATGAATAQPSNATVRPRRATPDEEELKEEQ